MAEMQWIKLRIDMFDDEKIKIIQSMPDGDALLVVWIRLIALAGKCNANGLVLVEDEFPYTDEMLSVIFNKPLQTVKLALTTFEKFRMIESTTKGIYITNFDKHQNIEGMERIREQNRIRKQRQRERNKALLLEELPSGSAADPEPGIDENNNVTSEITSMSRDMSRDMLVISLVTLLFSSIPGSGSAALPEGNSSSNNALFRSLWRCFLIRFCSLILSMPSMFWCLSKFVI